MNEDEKKMREEARALGLPTTRYATSPKSGKTHRNWIPRRELAAMIAEAKAGKPVADIAAAHNAAPGKPAFAVFAAPAAPAPAPANNQNAAHAPAPKRATPAQVETGKKWKMFLSEFQFTPGVRFLNSTANCPTAAAVREYATAYFKLTNSPFANDMEAKAKSAEATALFRETAALSPAKKINSRLAIWYGEPGTGKTTKAVDENPGASVVICNSEISPNELFRGFTFEDGKPCFKPCALRTAMEEGKTVILDEINLLSPDCQRALQTVTDGKDRVTLDDETIEIRPGFRVIGTMNLTVGDQVFPLPTPLVDRADELREFTLTDEAAATLAYC